METGYGRHHLSHSPGRVLTQGSWEDNALLSVGRWGLTRLCSSCVAWAEGLTEGRWLLGKSEVARTLSKAVRDTGPRNVCGPSFSPSPPLPSTSLSLSQPPQPPSLSVFLRPLLLSCLCLSAPSLQAASSGCSGASQAHLCSRTPHTPPEAGSEFSPASQDSPTSLPF